MQIKRLLITNRGEIALRVIRSAKKLAITTVALFSDADENADFVKYADEAVRIRGSFPQDTYLNIEKIIEIALKANCDAIHPGYGFLSENSEFVKKCEENSIIFIGPPSEAVELMGSKLKAKEIAKSVGVPTLDAIDLTEFNEDQLINLADSLTYPVLIKASHGGGGRGMRIVEKKGDFVSLVESAKREAQSAFGNPTVFVERYLTNPRHIEIQVLIDAYGNGYSLFERECSIQRRHQKIIEESPSVAVSEKIRNEMGDQAVALAKEVGYVNAGTVEFIFQDDQYYFLEMNTRLQVEHPVTELITGLDLVELQIRIAQGQEITHLNPIRHGHAIEARLCAEDPLNDYQPQAGKLIAFNFKELEGVRVDSGFSSGSEIPPFYDSLLAKVISYGRNRTEAISRLKSALSSAEIFGVKTNRELLCAILSDQDFIQGNFDTSFLEKRSPFDLINLNRCSEDQINALVLAAALSYLAASKKSLPVLKGVSIGWRNVFSSGQKVIFLDSDENDYEVEVKFGRFNKVENVFINSQALSDLRANYFSQELVDLETGGSRRFYKAIWDDDLTNVLVTSSELSMVLKVKPRLYYSKTDTLPGSLKAPMPGSVVKIVKKVGEVVSAGDPIIFIEAMKMEHAIRSPQNGLIQEISVTVGDQVVTGQQLGIVKES